MTTVYLDSSALIAFLYEKQDQPEKFEQTRHLIATIRDNVVSAVISFYALPELHDYVKDHQPETELPLAFRVSLVELFSIPLIVAPFLDREIFNRLRQQFNIADPDDARHVAVALARNCDAIITFDRHFAQVVDLIPAYTPAEFLATLTNPNAR